jgi:hypothetical protein
MQSPSRHLTLRTLPDGRRRYAAIYAGVPLCADKTTLSEAWECLKPYWPTTKDTVDLWDGDQGKFLEVSRPS